MIFPDFLTSHASFTCTLPLHDMLPGERDLYVHTHPEAGRVLCRCKGLTEMDLLALFRQADTALSFEERCRALGIEHSSCRGCYDLGKLEERLAQRTDAATSPGAIIDCRNTAAPQESRGKHILTFEGPDDMLPHPLPHRIRKTEIVIIGAGAVGLTAALAAHKGKCRDILVLEHQAATPVDWPTLPGLCLETGATVLSLSDRKHVTFTGPRVGFQQIQAQVILLTTGCLQPKQPALLLCRSAGIALHPITGGPIITEQCETSLPGVFVCEADTACQVGQAAAAYLHSGFFRMPTCPIEVSGDLAWSLPHTICPRDLADSLTITLGTQENRSPDANQYQSPRTLIIYRDHIIWKELAWPGANTAKITLKKEEIATLRYSLSFCLRQSSSTLGDTVSIK